MTGITFPRGHSDITVHLTDQGLWSIQREVEPFIEGYDIMGNPLLRQGGVYDMVVDQKQLLSTLTPEETRLLVGYCAHVCEHGRMDISTSIEALIHANSRKDWEQVTYLSEEIHATTEKLLTADETARRCLDCVT